MACPYNAQFFDDIRGKAVKDDPASEMSRSLNSKKAEVLLPEQEARPKVFYANMNLSTPVAEKVIRVLQQKNT